MFELIGDMFNDGFWMSICAILIIVCVLAIVALICYGLYYAIDSFFRPKSEEWGVVTGKTFIPAHNETILVYNAALKMNMPQIIHHPDSWNVEIAIGELTGNIEIGETLYNELNDGDNVYTVFSVGRLNKRNVYIKSIRR